MPCGCQQSQNSKILTIDQLIGMSYEQKLDLFRQGYIIGSSEIVNKVENNDSVYTAKADKHLKSSNIGITGLGLLSNINTLQTTTVTAGSLVLLALGILVMSGIYTYIGNWELRKLGIRQ